MAWNIENSATLQNQGDQTNRTITFGFTGTLDRTLILIIAVEKNATSIVVRDSTPSGDLWTEVFQTSSNNEVRGSIFYKVSDGDETQVYIEWTNENLSAFEVIEVSGLTITPKDVHSSNSGGPGTTDLDSGATSTTAQADELAVALMASDSAPNTTPRDWSGGSVFTERTWLPGDGSVDPGLSVATKDLSATAAITADFSTSGSGDGMVVGVSTFKEPSDPIWTQVTHRIRNDDGPLTEAA